MSFFSPLVAAASSAMQVAAATAAPLGATGATAATGSTAATVLKKGLTPTSNATLSPDILKALQNVQSGHASAIALKLPWLTHTFAGLFVACAVGLIFLLAVQTTKQEGLSGTIGGRVESTYRPRLGFDQQLARLTSYVALTMVFFAVVLSITGI
jgi:protein translocase SecG subunit